MHSERAPLFLKVAAWGGVIFLHFPLLIIATYAFNTEEAAFSFPPQGLTLKWFSVAAGRGDIIESVTLSLQIAALGIRCQRKLGNHQHAAARLLDVQVHLAFRIAENTVAQHALTQAVGFLFVIILFDT